MSTPVFSFRAVVLISQTDCAKYSTHEPSLFDDDSWYWFHETQRAMVRGRCVSFQISWDPVLLCDVQTVIRCALRIFEELRCKSSLIFDNAVFTRRTPMGDVMDTIAFSEVSKLRGLWYSISKLDELARDNMNLNTPYSPEDFWIVRDAFSQHHATMNLVCDFVAFDNIFIDSHALRRTGAETRLTQGLGGLAKLCKAVEIEPEVYETAVEQVQHYIDGRGLKKIYLEEEFPDKSYGSIFFDGEMEGDIDALSKDVDIPANFVNTGGCVERVLLYANVQRSSGAPVRLSETHRSVFEHFKGALPMSTVEVVTQKNPRDKVEGDVREAIEGIADMPPIFDMIVDRIAQSKERISIIDAAVQVRDEWKASCFRTYLWDVFLALRTREIPKLNYLRENLIRQLRTFDNHGTTRTRRTKVLHLTFVPFSMVEVSGSIHVPRHQDQDYVGFVGSWLGPHAA